MHVNILTHVYGKGLYFVFVLALLGYCDKPAALKLGRFTPIQKQYSVGAKISYTCYAGNIMTGIRIAYCQSNGKFTTPPVCNRKCFLTLTNILCVRD